MSNRKERTALELKWLNEKCCVHLNKLTLELLHYKPDNVVAFIRDWSKSNQESQNDKSITPDKQPNDNNTKPQDSEPQDDQPESPQKNNSEAKSAEKKSKASKPDILSEDVMVVNELYSINCQFIFIL